MVKKTWKLRLKEAEKTGRFTDDDMERAGDWTSCAVGEKFHPSRHRIDNYLMEDIFGEKTLELGMAFSDAVSECKIKRAIKLYEQIKKLSATEKKF